MHKRMRWRRVTVLSAHSYAPSCFRRFLLSSNGPFDLVATFLCPPRKRPKGAWEDRATHVNSNFRVGLSCSLGYVVEYLGSGLAIDWQLKSSNVVNVATKHHIRRILRITCEANMELSIVGIWSGRQEKAVVVHYPQILPRKRRQNTRATCRNHTDAWTKPYSLIKHISSNQNAQSLTKAYMVRWTIACDFLTSLWNMYWCGYMINHPVNEKHGF